MKTSIEERTRQVIHAAKSLMEYQEAMDYQDVIPNPEQDEELARELTMEIYMLEKSLFAQSVADRMLTIVNQMSRGNIADPIHEGSLKELIKMSKEIMEAKK